MPDLSSIPVSILIFVRNEEQDLPGCLDCIRWCEDVHVVDSGSSDRTVEIAINRGAHVVVRSYSDPRPFGGDEAAHKNWALCNINFEHQWIFLLDADERVPAELVACLRGVDYSDLDVSAFRLARRDYFFGRWLRHVTPSPFNIRLIRPERVLFERVTNPTMVIKGRIRELGAHFDHYPFSKGIRHWISKHNDYSSAEAEQYLLAIAQGIKFSWRIAIFERDRSVRRIHQKGIYYGLPFRPILMFGALYFFKGGFLDGYSGFTYAALRAMYEYMIVLKVREMRAVESSV